MSCTCRETSRGEICGCGGTYTRAEYERRRQSFSLDEVDAAWRRVERMLNAGLGFEEAGITVDRGWVPTDERLRTQR